MSEVPQISEAVQGYAELAQQLLADWTPYVTGLSTKVAAGTYGPEDIEADFSSLVKLVADSLFAIGSEAVDALAILTSDFSDESTVDGYCTNPAMAGTVRTLTIKGDLKSVTEQVLPKDRVKPVPATLNPKKIAFDLKVDGAEMKARTYDGFVVSTDAAGVVEEIPVSVTIG